MKIQQPTMNQTYPPTKPFIKDANPNLDSKAKKLSMSDKRQFIHLQQVKLQSNNHSGRKRT